MAVIYGEERAAEENVLGYRELLLDFEEISPEYQALGPRLESGDPDDFQGTIHYHKGNLFLQYLEKAYGRDVFDQFIGHYFDEYAFGTITTEVFLDYLDEQLLAAYPGKVSRKQAEDWIYGPGLPDDAPIPSSTTLDNAAELAALWSQGEVDIETVPGADWSPQTIVHFINSLSAELPAEKLSTLDAAFGFSNTRNAEIGRTWFIQVAKRQHRVAYGKLEEHLNRFGRTRLVEPVYQALVDNGADADLAKEIFERARKLYHPQTITSIERVLQPGATD